MPAVLYSARSYGVTLEDAARFVGRKHRPGSRGISNTHHLKHRLQDKVLSEYPSEIAAKASYLSLF